jgi:hypothetical protein
MAALEVNIIPEWIGHWDKQAWSSGESLNFKTTG